MNDKDLVEHLLIETEARYDSDLFAFFKEYGNARELKEFGEGMRRRMKERELRREVLIEKYENSR